LGHQFAFFSYLSALPNRFSRSSPSPLLPCIPPASPILEIRLRCGLELRKTPSLSPFNKTIEFLFFPYCFRPIYLRFLSPTRSTWIVVLPGRAPLRRFWEKFFAFLEFPFFHETHRQARMLSIALLAHFHDLALRNSLSEDPPFLDFLPLLPSFPLARTRLGDQHAVRLKLYRRLVFPNLPFRRFYSALPPFDH